MGILVGGYAFEIALARLTPIWHLTIATGVALAVIESGLRWLWLHQCRGLLVLLKLGLIVTVPLVGDWALPVLTAVVVLASVSSHMPAKYRYYSVIDREVIPDAAGPGSGRSRSDGDDD